ncbi:MAG: IGHMBP2 family helicase [Cyclobacteriaceae bacterium]
MANSRTHFSHLLELLKIERAEDRKQYQQKIQNRSIEDRKKDGVSWYPLEMTKSFLDIGERWTVEVRRKSGQNQRHMFQVGSSAGLFVQDGKKTQHAPGIISKVEDNSIYLMLHRDEPPDWIEDGILGIDLLFDESTYNEMERTIETLIKTDNARLKELIDISLGNRKPGFKQEHGVSLDQLNESQNKAVNNILSAEDICLVHGPPGTGKTTTLIEAICLTVKNEKQVLVTAPSNSAVDIIVEKLHQKNINVVRIGHPARVTEEVVSHTLDAHMSNHSDIRLLKELRKQAEQMRRLAKQYKRKFGREEAQQRKTMLIEAKRLKGESRALESHIVYDVINKADVIACTLIGCNNQYLQKKWFKTVFIDESSQALEAAAWIPIMKANRAIMAGDHKQLPPTIKSKEADKGGLGETIFERMIKLHHADTMLQTQYRMHPDIVSFSNECFYQNQLITDKQVVERETIFDEKAVFIDTAGAGYSDQMNPETLSTFNLEEAQFVISFLNKLTNEQPRITELTFGIIAPYKAQIEQLRKALHNFEWPDNFLKQVTINTVDAFQGQERDVIIISMTRSNDRGEIGFLADQRRLNVAMTRARHQLVLVGDSATLSNNAFMDKMIQHYQQNNWYHSVFEYLY